MGAHYEFARTAKQVEIMRHVLQAADTGTPITLEQLRAALSYKCSKQAVLCSLRYLAGYGFIEKSYHGNRTMQIAPTPRAYPMFRGTPAPMVSL